AVTGQVKGLNAKGACIGPRGQRVTNVMQALGGEKIDIIDFNEDPSVYVGNALAPSKVVRVEVLDEEAQLARVTVPDYQLSLAIGKEGQNARLAARLTGWKIDIHSDADKVESIPGSHRFSVVSSILAMFQVGLTMAQVQQEGVGFEPTSNVHSNTTTSTGYAAIACGG